MYENQQLVKDLRAAQEVLDDAIEEYKAQQE